MPLPQVLNIAINETLSRTTMTSVTTLMALLALFLFGGEVIRSFTAAMLFGVLFGTYSSIFIAAPLLILFKLRPGALSQEGGEAKTGDSVPAEASKA
jgi:SecD/SecF fusion protein